MLVAFHETCVLASMNDVAAVTALTESSGRSYRHWGMDSFAVQPKRKGDEGSSKLAGLPLGWKLALGATISSGEEPTGQKTSLCSLIFVLLAGRLIIRSHGELHVGETVYRRPAATGSTFIPSAPVLPVAAWLVGLCVEGKKSVRAFFSTI